MQRAPSLRLIPKIEIRRQSMIGQLKKYLLQDGVTSEYARLEARRAPESLLNINQSDDHSLPMAQAHVLF